MLQRFYNRYVGCGDIINSMKLFNNNHSVFALHYHLILAVKYRRRVTNDPISARLSEIFEYIGNE